MAYIHASCEFDNIGHPTKTSCDVYTGTAFYNRNEITVNKGILLSFIVLQTDMEHGLCIKCCRICLIEEITE